MVCSPHSGYDPNTPYTIYTFKFCDWVGTFFSSQVVNAGDHARARFPMQTMSEFERSSSFALTVDGPEFMALENVLLQVPLMPRLEGPSAIPKNSTGMGPAPQAVMLPPTRPPHIF